MELRHLAVTPHVAQNTTHRRSAIDGRTTRYDGYGVSQRKRKLVEQDFGWMKTIGGLRKLWHRGGLLVTWIFTFSAAAYNIVRLRCLLLAESLIGHRAGDDLWSSGHADALDGIDWQGKC